MRTFSSFTAAHHLLFTYSLDLQVEVINLRSLVEEIGEEVFFKPLTKSTDGKPTTAALSHKTSMASFLIRFALRNSHTFAHSTGMV